MESNTKVIVDFANEVLCGEDEGMRVVVGRRRKGEKEGGLKQDGKGKREGCF